MNRLLIGWCEIFNFMGVAYRVTDKKRGETWGEWTIRKGCELMERGCPIFFLSQIDNKPRMYAPDFIQWAKERHDAEMDILFVKNRERKEAEAEAQAKAEEEGVAASESAPVEE